MTEALFLLLFTVYCLSFRDSPWFLALPMIVILPLFVYEGIQFSIEKSRYWMNIWNSLDAIRMVIFVVFCFLEWGGATEEMSTPFLILSVVATYIRGISFFRVFKTTRYMVDLIIEVIIDMRGFLVLLVYSTSAFGVIFTLLPSAADSTVNSFTMSYLLNLGEFDTSDFTAIDWVIFITATIINPIVMLNLLIAIMSDTYGRVQSTNVITDRKELLKMIFEIEMLYYWNRATNDRSYLQLCVSKSDESKESGTVADVVHVLKKEMLKVKAQVIDNEKILNEIRLERENDKKLLQETHSMMTALCSQMNIVTPKKLFPKIWG